MKRQISLTDPAMSVFPVLGSRVDLLIISRSTRDPRTGNTLMAGSAYSAESVFQLTVCQPDDSWKRTAGFWIRNAALLTIFLPAPTLFWFETTRRDLAAESWSALVAQVSKAATGKQPSRTGMEQCTDSRFAGSHCHGGIPAVLGDAVW